MNMAVTFESPSDESKYARPLTYEDAVAANDPIVWYELSKQYRREARSLQKFMHRHLHDMYLGEVEDELKVQWSMAFYCLELARAK